MAYFPCIISKNVVDSENPVSVDIDFSSPVNIDGITIKFGENYPKKFSISYVKSSTSQTKNYTSGKALFEAKDSVTNVTKIRITVTEMQWSGTRLRIYSMDFGYGKVFKNEDVISSTLKNYISLNGSVCQQIDFTITVKNYDHAFSIENPKSFLNELDTNSTIDVSYGYELPSGSVEWVKGGHLYCTEWDSNNKSATIKAADRMRMLTDEYVDFAPYIGMKAYNLFDEIFSKLGITNYYYSGKQTFIDQANVSVENLVIPPMPYRDVLRLLANICDSVLVENVDGSIEIANKRTTKNGDPYDYSTVDYFLHTTHVSNNIKLEDMISYPKMTKGKRIKNLNVVARKYVKYSDENDREKIIDQQSGNAGDLYLYVFEKAYQTNKIVLSGDATITRIGPYFIEFRFNSNGNVSVTGIPYYEEKRNITYKVNDTGETVTFDNPLIQDAKIVTGTNAIINRGIGDGLVNYYKQIIDYEYGIRGNPEIEMFDTFNQIDEFGNHPVMISESTFTFNQSFSQRIKVKAIEGVN